jgi:hypothetical protein
MVDIYIDTSEVNGAVHNCQITQVWKVAQDGVQISWEKHTAEDELPERGKGRNLSEEIVIDGSVRKEAWLVCIFDLEEAVPV